MERTTPGNEEALVSEPRSNFPPEWSLSSFEKAFGRPAQAAAPYLGQRAEPESINPPFLALTPIGTLLKRQLRKTEWCRLHF